MYCKRCHIIFKRPLEQSGKAHPKSYICPVCSTLHDDEGELYQPAPPPMSDVRNRLRIGVS